MKLVWFVLVCFFNECGLAVEGFQSSSSRISQFSHVERRNNERTRIHQTYKDPESQNSSNATTTTSPALHQEIPSATTLSYYLLWSPTILRKTIISLCVLLTGRFIFENWVSHSFLSFTEGTSSNSVFIVIQKLLQAVVLPLLSSACCGVQLLINLMVGAGGCVGFNKKLGPLRPYFFAVLLNTLIPKAFVPMNQGIDFATIRLRTIQLVLAFLPEIVHLWNITSAKRLQSKKTSGFGNVETSTSYQLELSIPGMGCVACINKINNSLRRNQAVSDTQAWLNEETGGRARVQYNVNSYTDAESIAESLAEAVKTAGFVNCKIENLRLVARE
mmetsp:Transcript_26864/g.40809  ORF Transcript_26864/g.40809 Transcript_26864/m.40809 type:complete len:331 (+) Transcript_26864:99-1091(+)